MDCARARELCVSGPRVFLVLPRDGMNADDGMRRCGYWMAFGAFWLIGLLCGSRGVYI